MNRARLCQIMTLCAMFAVGAPVFADGLNARIQSPTVAESTPFQLVLSGNTADLTAAPDLSPLEADFDILGTSQAHQTQIVNGARSDTLKWTVTLAPKSMGTLSIPIIHAGTATSNALSVNVVDAASLPVAQTPGAPEISVSLPEGSHYVHQEIPVTLRVVSGANLQRGDLSLPQSPDFTLTQSGDDITTQVAGANGPVTVMERTYMLRPQTDGDITLPPITLNAVIRDPQARSLLNTSPFQNMFGRAGNDPFAGLFNTGQQIAVRSAPITFTVNANPAGTDTWFLPAKDVQITANWAPQTATFKVGESVTRSIQVMALGATGTQLPDLEIPQADGLRIYLDDTQNRTVDTPDGSAAMREFRYSVVPTSGGQVVFPQVQVQWFDTNSETQQTAILPAETITVEGAVVVQKAEPAVAEAQTANMSTPQAVTPRPWKTVAVVALLAALSAVIGRRVYTRRRRQNAAPSSAMLRAAALRRAREAQRHGDMIALHAAGQAWQGLAGVKTHAALAQNLPVLAEAWTAFEHMLFGQNNSHDPARGAAVLGALEKADRAISTQKANRYVHTPPLRPLYAVGNNAL